jgi:hypothetical protein
MATYSLSIAVHGPGTDPNNRSHWALFLHQLNNPRGHMLQVLLIDQDRLWYQFDTRSAVQILSPDCDGYFTIADLDVSQYQRAYQLISEEAAPRDGINVCQDWVLSCLIALEAEEIIPAGTSERISTLVGLPAENAARYLGGRWIGAGSD